MPIHVKKNSFVAARRWLWRAQPAGSSAQDARAGRCGQRRGRGTRPPAAQPHAASTLNENATEIDSSTSTALDYLFNHKAGEGTTMKAGNDVASAIADKIKAVDVLKTPGLDDPAVRARFETYLSLKEVPQAADRRVFRQDEAGFRHAETGPDQDIFGAWKMLYCLSEYEDLDAGISRELANRVENFWNTDRTKNGLEVANDKLRRRHRDRQP